MVQDLMATVSSFDDTSSLARAPRAPAPRRPASSPVSCPSTGTADYRSAVDLRNVLMLHHIHALHLEPPHHHHSARLRIAHARTLDDVGARARGGRDWGGAGPRARLASTRLPLTYLPRARTRGAAWSNWQGDLAWP